ncbi:MAG TPA: TspO/MBR family protein [Chitinophagaceae bacterium]|nr:TspO/MBR family protein [Chitinophagaceae bacterium]
MKPIFKLLISLAIPLATGAIAGIFTSNSVDTWYITLNRPGFAPPNWVFGPVWTTLYILMGISLYMIWRLPADDRRNQALGVFIIQLALNFFWSFLFFYLHSPGAALVDIILLWLAIIIMLRRFYRCKPIAAWINIPYLLWVSFALALNWAFYRLN